jgi:outer membrane lipoprotein-sorting protein
VRPVALRTATLEELTEKLRVFGGIQTMKSTVDLRLSVALDEQAEGERKIRDFTEVRGFILIRRPSSIRMIAELPVVKTRAFDMVSDGKNFKVYIPQKKRFLVGNAASEATSENRVDRVRPQHILEALLIDPPRENEKHQFLENLRERRHSYQIIHLLTNGAAGKLNLSRKLWFDSAGSEIVRQQVFDEQADLVTDVYYSEWALEEALPFPGTIFLSRPKDGYELEVRITKAGLNEAIPERAFVLEPPKDVDVERIGEDPEQNEGTPAP